MIFIEIRRNLSVSLVYSLFHFRLFFLNILLSSFLFHFVLFFACHIIVESHVMFITDAILFFVFVINSRAIMYLLPRYLYFFFFCCFAVSLNIKFEVCFNFFRPSNGYTYVLISSLLE